MGRKLLISFLNWKKSLVGQLLLRFWVCHILFFIIIGSIQYTSLKESLYLSVEQNLYSDYQTVKKNMISWLLSNEIPPGKLAELRPGNFAAFYSTSYKLNFMVHSYGKQTQDISEFLQSPPAFDLFEKAVSGKPFIIGETKEDQYMLLVKPIIFSGDYTSYTPDSPHDPILRFFDKKVDIYFPIVGYAVVGEPMSQTVSILEKNFHSYVFNALVILFVSTILTAFALQKPLEPLLSISSTARKIAGGRYNLRLPEIEAPFEIKQLREALNHMLGQIEHALNTERQAKDRMARFIADASHELRTPLTSIHGFLEILLRNKNLDRETLESSHQTMLIETERLIRLTEGLLTLNRISQEDPEKEKFLPSTLQDVLPEIVPLFSTLLEDRILLVNGQNLKNLDTTALASVVPSCSRPLPLKPDELKQILYNLINNAIQHTKTNGVIEIITVEEKSCSGFSIKDNGKGIPPEDLPHIFDRFFRGDRSRSHAKNQSCGLGLAIVSELVKLRGGKISVQSTPGEGTVFTITFAD